MRTGTGTRSTRLSLTVPTLACAVTNTVSAVSTIVGSAMLFVKRIANAPVASVVALSTVAP